MSYEVEQKFPAADLADVERRLTELGGKADNEVTQVDLYFAHPERDFAQTDEALRIRRVGEANFITYKGPKVDESTKTRREIELDLPPGGSAADDFVELLAMLGFRPVAEVSKHRRTLKLDWQGREVEAALDQVRGVGTFVELELEADDENLAAAQESLRQLVQRLDLSASERRSYLELLLAGKSAAK